MSVERARIGEGEMGERMRDLDWSRSPLGAPEHWPQSLRTSVSLMTGSKQPMFIAWGDGLGFLYNDSYAVILGKKHPAALGRPFREVWSEIWSEISPLVARALAGEATWLENLHLVMERNGVPEDTWYTFSYSPIRDERDEIAGMFCACIETTAQVLAERRSTAERERLFEMSRDLFAVATYDGYLRTINPAWSRMLGRSDDELLGRPFAEIIHPDDLAMASDVIETLMKGEPAHHFHVRLLKADGSPISFAWSAVPDGILDSGIFYTVGRDISDEQRREESLRQSQKMEAVGRLTGGLAHDFNNLLQAVQGNLELIRAAPADPTRIERLASNGMKAAERGAKLTSQLLAFSRSQKLELKPTAIGPLIVGMDEFLQRSLGPQFHLALDVETECAALVDPAQLETAIVNLAINARDAMPAGGEIRIAVRTRDVTSDPGLAAGQFVEITVSDDGHGMSGDVAARAFDPFFTTKAVGDGTGLGLSQVYGMANQAGGVARIESTGDTGTSVALLLRAVPVPESAAVTDEFGTRPGKAKSSTVVVIDDDPEVRQLLGDSLEALDYNYALAEDGERGLAAIERHKPDVVLLDFAMPGLSGADVARRIRQSWPDLAIVFISGYSNSEAIEAAVGAEAALLKKPFRLSDLDKLLNELVPANRASASGGH